MQELPPGSLIEGHDLWYAELGLRVKSEIILDTREFRRWFHDTQWDHDRDGRRPVIYCHLKEKDFWVLHYTPYVQVKTSEDQSTTSRQIDGYAEQVTRARAALAFRQFDSDLPDQLADFISQSVDELRLAALPTIRVGLKPRWDGTERTLFYDGKQVLHLSRHARNIIAILGAFERYAWGNPVRPVIVSKHGDSSDDSKAPQIREAIRTLNEKPEYAACPIMFESNGEVVTWSIRDAGAAARENPDIFENPATFPALSRPSKTNAGY